MTCTARVRRIAAEPVETFPRTCCTRIRKFVYIYEPETVSYFDVIGIPNDSTVYHTGTPQQITGAALWTLINDELLILKTTLGLTHNVNNLYTKIDSIYLMIGGTATQHKYNLCNAVDTDAGFRCSFFGGWIHGPTGALPNGTNAYMDSHWNPTVNGSVNARAFGMYSRTNDTSGTQLYGVFDGASVVMHNNLSSANFCIGNVSSALSYSASPSTRFMFARRTSSTFMEGYRDGTSIGTTVAAAGAVMSNANFFFGARNLNGVGYQFPSGHEIAFGIVTGITAITNAEAGAIRTFCDNLQLGLGRNV